MNFKTTESTNALAGPLSPEDEQRARDAFESWLTETATSMAMSELAPHRGMCAGGDFTEADRRAAVRVRAAHLRQLLRAALIDWNELPIGEDVIRGCWATLGFCDLRRARDPEREFPTLSQIADANSAGGADAAQAR